MRFVGRPLYTLVVYSLCLFAFNYSYGSEYSKSEIISLSESDSSQFLPAAIETPFENAKTVDSPFVTISNKKGKLLYGSLFLSLICAASIALYFMVPKMAEGKKKEEAATTQTFDELENELLEWFTSDPVLKGKGSRKSFESDFNDFKGKEYSIVFSEHQDTVLPPEDDLMVRKFKLDFWNDYEKMLRPYFYYNQLQIGRFMVLMVENAVLGALNYQGKSFFNFERGETGRLTFDYEGCRKFFDEYKPKMSEGLIEGLKKGIKMITKYEIYFNRVMAYKEKHCSEIEQRRHLALKPNHEIVADLKKKNDIAP